MTDVDPYALTGWNKEEKEGQFDFTLPTGQRCLLRKLKLEDILELNMVDAYDTFSALLMAENRANSDMEMGISILHVLSDEEKRQKLMGKIDPILPIVILQPQVLAKVPAGRTKNPAKTYVDDIPLEDRIAIFGAVFQGLGGMSSFRQEQEGSVGAVAEIEGVPENSQ